MRGAQCQLLPSNRRSQPASAPPPLPAQPKPTTFSGQRALNFVLENQAARSIPTRTPQPAGVARQATPRTATHHNHHHAITMPSRPDQELIDKTLLFNIKLVRVDEPDGKGGFKSSVQDRFK